MRNIDVPGDRPTSDDVVVLVVTHHRRKRLHAISIPFSNGRASLPHQALEMLRVNMPRTEAGPGPTCDSSGCPSKIKKIKTLATDD